jgi:hypothetical protein
MLENYVHTAWCFASSLSGGVRITKSSGRYIEWELGAYFSKADDMDAALTKFCERVMLHSVYPLCFGGVTSGGFWEDLSKGRLMVKDPIFEMLPIIARYYHLYLIRPSAFLVEEMERELDGEHVDAAIAFFRRVLPYDVPEWEEI